MTRFSGNESIQLLGRFHFSAKVLRQKQSAALLLKSISLSKPLKDLLESMSCNLLLTTGSICNPSISADAHERRGATLKFKWQATVKLLANKLA